jgi:hypothetical protein
VQATAGDPEAKSAKQPAAWRRWAGLGCGVLILALVAALAGGAFSTHRMVAWGVARLADRVVASLPQGTPDVVRDDLRHRLDCVVRAARERRVSEHRLGEFARACTDALADKMVSADEEERIATIADAICREAAGAPPP